MQRGFLTKLLPSQTLLADDAMGTMLHSHGVDLNQCLDELNLANPTTLTEVHREYIEAGSPSKTLLMRPSGNSRIGVSWEDLPTLRERNLP